MPKVLLLPLHATAARVRLARHARLHASPVQLCWGPGEETIVTGGYDQAVRVWDTRSRSWDAIQTCKPFADSVTSVAVSAKWVPSGFPGTAY